MNQITINRSAVLTMLATIEQILESYPILITQLRNVGTALAPHDNPLRTIQGAVESTIQAFQPHIDQLEMFRELLQESLK